MITALRKLGIRQLEDRVRKVRSLAKEPPPRSGWLSAIREALGMTTSQLAVRQGVSRQAVAEQEHREVEGSITLSALRRAAAAMDCDLYYALVPRQPLPKLLMERARLVAARNLGRVAHSMALEEQSVSDVEFRRQVEDMAEDLVRETPQRLWDEPIK